LLPAAAAAVVVAVVQYEAVSNWTAVGSRKGEGRGRATEMLNE